MYRVVKRGGGALTWVLIVHSCLMFHLTLSNIGYLQYNVKYTDCPGKISTKRVKE